MSRTSHLLIVVAGLLLSACVVPADGGGGSVATTRSNSNFVAQNRYIVTPGPGGGEFTVLGQAGAAGSDFFCAAADYAHRRLGVSDAERVMLIAPVAKNPAYGGQRTGTFRVASRGEAPERANINVSMRRAGENLQIGHARSMCVTHRVGWLD